MTETARKMAELAETTRHNRQQELIGKANVISNVAGSLASIYTKRIPSAMKDVRDNLHEGFASQGDKANRGFRRNK